MKKDVKSLVSRIGQLPASFRLHSAQGVEVFGDGDPAFDLFVRNDRGWKAIHSLSELELVEAYMRGDLDIEGDFVRAIAFQSILSDRAPWLKIWRRLKPLLIGRERCNPRWIARHYDSKNVQLIATDHEYDTYTPGIYASSDDSLEEGARRKLDFAFESLQLAPDDSLLDVGCGWGGFLRYCAQRGVRAKGITLSRDQLEYTRLRIREEGLDAEAIHQDFFTYAPEVRVDAVSMMGVLEDLSDYDEVLPRLSSWLRPGGRVYLDFATARRAFDTSAFITKYIWPGTFRKVYLPELVASIWKSPFEIVSLHNDRRNYHLWGAKMHERWVERKATALKEVDEAAWRMFRVLFAAAASIMDAPSLEASACRMVLQLAHDTSSSSSFALQRSGASRPSVKEA